MRGRLIQRLVCVLRRLDPAATAAVGGGGYDPLFREAVPVDDGTQLGATSRREEAAIRLQCQLNRDRKLAADMMTRGGHQKLADLIIVLFMEDLENASMVDAGGNVQIFPGDRIEKIEDLNGNAKMTFDNPPGMYVLGGSIGPAGYGLAAFGTPQVNLYVLACSPEELGEV
jgi:hypothetical protein